MELPLIFLVLLQLKDNKILRFALNDKKNLIQLYKRNRLRETHSLLYYNKVYTILLLIRPMTS